MGKLLLRDAVRRFGLGIAVAMVPLAWVWRIWPPWELRALLWRLDLPGAVAVVIALREFLETVAALRSASVDEPLARTRVLVDDRCDHRRLDTLSAGQRRKVCLCAALCGRPDVLLLDEPEAALDVAAVDALGAEFAGLADDGRVVLVACHGSMTGVRPRGTLLVAEGRLQLQR